MWLLFVIEALLAIAGVIFMLKVYASWKTVPWYAYIVTAVGWFMAATPIFLAPADIYQVAANLTGEEGADIDLLVLKYIWKVDYWIMFFLTWVFCPFLQDFVDSGGFTFWQKFRAALIINGIFYGSALLGVVGIVIYLAVAQNFGKDEFLGLAASLGNSVGLCLLILLLGFGLVDIPRRFWRLANLEMTQKLNQFDAALIAGRMEEANTEYAAAITVCHLTVTFPLKLNPGSENSPRECLYSFRRVQVLRNNYFKGMSVGGSPGEF